jgi:hypothetical protein
MSAIRFLLQASQLFNNGLARFVPTYRENANTDGMAGMVGGAAAGVAAVYAWATGLDATTAAGLVTGAGYLGVQGGGYVQNWLDERKAAKGRIDPLIAAHAAANLLPSEPPDEVTEDTPIYQWQGGSGDWHKPLLGRNTVKWALENDVKLVRFVQDGPAYNVIDGMFV